MSRVSTDAFTPDDLYDQEVIHEAHQIDLLLIDMIDAVPRFEIAALIALTKRFCDICEQADIDPEAAFSQIADGVQAERFTPFTEAFIHTGNNTLN